MNFARPQIPFLVKLLFLLAALFLVALPIGAQLSTANVAGDVEDPSGARIAAVTIKLLNLRTGTESIAITSASGEFLLPGILPGLYSMQVSRDGFAAVHLVGLNLNVGELRQFRIKLRLSTVEQTIEVDASGQSLNTDDAQMTTVVDSYLVTNLPLNGRSFQDLIAMTPGAISVSPQIPRSEGFSVNGQPADTNTYWVDGVSANFGSGPLDIDLKVPPAGQYASVTSLGTTQGMVALDALQEFRVVASTSSVEYGHAPGGQFSLLTRQGTDEIHGTAYAYLRNGYFDATDWFGGYVGAKSNAYFHQQDIGGSLSFPLYFSKRKPAENPILLFGSYEELHVQQRTAPLVQYAPDTQLYSNAPASVQAALAAFPIEWAQGIQSGLVPVGSYEPSPPSYVKSSDFRADRTFSSRMSGFVRYGDTPSGSESLLLSTNTDTKLHNQSITLGLDGEVSPRAGNEFRFGWGRTNSKATTSIVNSQIDLSTVLGSPGTPNQTRAEVYLHMAGIGETAAFADSAQNALRQLQVRDTFSLQRGPHLFRIGFDLRNLHSAVEPQPWTIEADFLDIPSVLNNSVSSLIVRRNESAFPVFHEDAAFLQDEWKVARNLNASVGVRWDVDPPPTSSDGRNAFRVTGSDLQPQSISVSPRGTPLWKTDWHSVGPRAGIAWQPFQHTGRELVLRGGLGVLFDTPGRVAAAAFTGLGFSSTALTSNVALPSTTAPPAIPDALGPSGLGYMFPQHFAYPHSLQWNVSLEHALGEHEAVALSYVGASGRGLLMPRRHTLSGSNAVLREVVTFPTGLSSRFDSFQLEYRGQYTSRLAWMTSYVWSHTLDFGSTSPWAAPTYGNADTDIRHNLQAALSWTLPQVKGAGFVHNAFSGWGLDGRFFLRTGYPVTVLGNLFYDPVTGERFYTGADLIPGKPLSIYNKSLPGGRMLNGGPNVADGAFQLPSGNAVGSAPRNMARGFGAQQLGLSLRRDIHLYDRLYLQLRADAFNPMNSHDFGYITPYLTDQLFGQPTLSLNQSYGQTESLYQPGGPRSLQWMFRVRW